MIWVDYLILGIVALSALIGLIRAWSARSFRSPSGSGRS
jgi:uncharacterized membrane protein required for colicin V production